LANQFKKDRKAKKENIIQKYKKKREEAVQIQKIPDRRMQPKEILCWESLSNLVN